MEQERIIHFLYDIGIPVIETELSDACFLPGIQLKGATILRDPKRNRYIGDLLHEAGHIAVTDPLLRPLIGSKSMDPAWPSDGDEIAAVLWSFAALSHLQLTPEVVFHSEGYKGQSKWLIESFESGNFIGLPLLEWMGLCVGNEKAVQLGVDPFPKMIRWKR